MLMQNFMAADDLGITEPQRDALQKVLVLLETGKLIHTPLIDYTNSDHHPKYSGRFNMTLWQADVLACGTVCCIGGTAELIGEISFAGWATGDNDGLYSLFRPGLRTDLWAAITPAQAARALRSYLTCGDAKWSEAVS